MILYLISDYAEIDYLEALADLETKSQAVAARWEVALLDAFAHLGRFPFSGSSRPELAPQPLRVWMLDRHIIVYDPDTTPPTIIAVLHSARDIPAVLLQRAGFHARES